MLGRPFLPKQEKLTILIDSLSFDNLITKNDKTANTILKYSGCDLFEFIRSPKDTNHQQLNNISALIKRYDNEGNLHSLDIVNDKIKSMTWFGYKMQDVEDIGKYIYKKQSLSTFERETILLVFIQATFNIRKDMRILTTDNKVLLSNRTWFESHFPGGILNIATLEETKEIMDLFAKYSNTYYISFYYLTDKWLWYWYSFRLKIPNYHVGDEILDALANRFVYLLMSIDEIGFQFYTGVNKTTMENTIYHFNYLILLVSGIFDALAIKTKKQLGVKFDGENIDSRTSLNPRAGRDFLKAVKDKKPELRKHIEKYSDLIKLIYKFRELIVHREMLPRSAFEMTTEKWKANFISIDDNISELIRKCHDRNQNYEPITVSGIYNKIPGHTYLEPYHFSKAITILLISFCNTYLQFLGFNNYLEECEGRPKYDHFIKEMKKFREDKLGF